MCITHHYYVAKTHIFLNNGDKYSYMYLKVDCLKYKTCRYANAYENNTENLLIYVFL